MLLSIIIPLGPEEKDLQTLLFDLENLSLDAEIILAYSKDQTKPDLSAFAFKHPVKSLPSKPGRAAQMNAGSDLAKGTYLWFLHADSRCTNNTLTSLTTILEQDQNSLLYFDLAFIRKKPSPLFLNELGAKFRSNILKTPFGDQGFCIKKTLFNKIGKYQTTAQYGEDHLLIYQARKAGIRTKPIKAKLLTSARKYQKNGWLKTTLLHQYLWIKQMISKR